MADDREAFDFDILRKRLCEEYAFISHQKQEIQNEYATVISKGDSLFRSLWINGQQWKNILRLKGGAKLTSECIYTANLLDSINFVDSYTKIGFREVKYAAFLQELKDNVCAVKSMLIIADELHLDTSAFIRTILVSLYGSCLFPADQLALLNVAKNIIEYSLVFSNAPLAIFNDEFNSFKNILQVILETSSPARGFLVSSCRQAIINILLDGSMFWTLEEQELLSVMDINSVRNKFGEPGNPGTSDRILLHMEKSWAKLFDAINFLLCSINESIDCLPDSVLLIVSYFYNFSLKRGFTQKQSRIIILRYLFNQVITPWLVRPQPFLMDIEVRASNIALFNLRKVVDILRTVVLLEADEVPVDGFGPEASEFYEKLDREPFYGIVDKILARIPDNDESVIQNVDSFPGLTTTSVLITKKDLDLLVSLVTKCQCYAEIIKNPEYIRRSVIDRVLEQANLSKILSHVEGMISAQDVKKLSIGSNNIKKIHTDLQKIFQSFNKPLVEDDEVMLVTMGADHASVDCPGMLPEEKILGMPTPKAQRKPASEIPSSIIQQEPFDTSNLTDSDSNDSSGDEKPSGIPDPKLDEKVQATDEFGFENSFVDFENTSPPKSLNLDPFEMLETAVSPQPIDPNDPFTSVVQSPWQQPPAVDDVLVRFDDGDKQPSSGAERSSSSPHPLTSSTDLSPSSDIPFSSSGSHSSTERSGSSSTSLSSGSDGAVVQTRNIVQPKSTLTKKREADTLSKGRRSLKGIQNAITTQIMPTKRGHKKKPNKGSLVKPKTGVMDANGVATVIASASSQASPATAKNISEDIIEKYSKLKRVRASSVNERPSVSQKPTVEILPLFNEDDVIKDVKNKLRYVLSSASKPVLPLKLEEYTRRLKRCDSDSVSSKLISFLKREMADAMANRNTSMVARLHETLNATLSLSSSRHLEVLKDLQQDYLDRKPYISYLVRSRQGLMCTREFIENMLKRVQRDREICCRYLISQCVAMYLENCKEPLELFVRKFKRLSMSDEKSEETKLFLQYLKEVYQNDPIWLGSNEKQRSEIVDAVERFVLGRVYLNALYAFGETDIYRDDVFHDSVENLCKTIGDDFTVLDIKKEYQREAPWFPAQNELFTLAAYKTPFDKLKCIQRCCKTIMTLLAMSSGSGAVGADAFTPVLIYVVMHANPRGLLTTIDFTNSYLSEPLTGEQYYCWMQFCSAIQFIKILLEENNSKKT